MSAVFTPLSKIGPGGDLDESFSGAAQQGYDASFEEGVAWVGHALARGVRVASVASTG